MKKFNKIGNNGWTSLETIVGRAAGKYPYCFLMCTRGEENNARHHWYEVTSEEDERGFLKCLSKRLLYKMQEGKSTE